MHPIVRLAAAGAVLALVAGTGCLIHRGPGGLLHIHPLHPRVVISAGHVHSAHCGHYHWRGAWYHWGGHVHGPHCGHVLRGGVWLRLDND